MRTMQGMSRSKPFDNMAFRFLLPRSHNYEKRLLNSHCFCGCPSNIGKTSSPTGRIWIKYGI